jgi:phosphohistidine swiveling domain-containing protein
MATKEEIGPKAATLVALSEAGLPVPEFRVLDVAAYRAHAGYCEIPTLLAIAGGEPLEAKPCAEAILSIPVHPQVERLLRSWYRELGGGHLAVRSSANAEDLLHASFAGQHGTFFISGADELVERVRDCWASLYSERAVRYREWQGVRHRDIAMAVIVQRLVPAVAAGVVFTVDPVDGSPGVFLEAGPGIGESLVSGKVTPDRYVFEPTEGLPLRHVEVGNKPVQIVEDGTGAVEEQAVSPQDAIALCIDEGTAREVAQLALRAGDVLGKPVDVEWAYDGEQTWLLQARPITTGIAHLHPTTASASDKPIVAAVTPDIWSNLNTGEILPDVATPMTWSVIYGHADDILGGMLGAFGVRMDAKKLVGLVGGRIYFNLSMLRDTFRTLPGIDPDTALGGMQNYVELPTFEDTKPPLGVRLMATLRTLRVMPGYVMHHTPKKAMIFAAHMRKTTEASVREIDASPDMEGALRLVRSLNGEFSEFNDTLAYMGVAMFGFGLLTGVCRKWLDDTTGALANRMVAGRGGVESAEAGHEMWRFSALARDATGVRSAVLVGTGWADVHSRLVSSASAGDAKASEFLDAWDSFMAEHGHHRRGELEFGNPTWAETPEYVLGVVRSYLADDRGSDPLRAYAERAAAADRAVADSLATLRNPLKRAIFKRVLGWGRASARTRENMKSEAVRWMVAIRHALLALGGRMAEADALDRADDIFFFEYEELPALVEDGEEDWRRLVAERRAEHARLEKLSPPPVVIGAWDERSGPWTAHSDSRVLTGISVSAGCARGPARVFLSADTDEPVLPGEILVAPFTDPGWTPYFVPAAGIVMDMGGLLSHGSIIAREYGIPAVVNVGPATRIISTGQIIEVDGDAGEVRIIG